MEFIELAKKRYSVRRYKDKKVEADKLDRILEAAHVAPTAADRQPVRLIVVQDEEGLGKIGKGADIYGAPLAVIVCADHGRAWTRPYDGKKTTDIDAAHGPVKEGGYLYRRMPAFFFGGKGSLPRRDWM